MRTPSPALVVATLALFVSLGGTALAVDQTIFSEDIVDGEVKNVDLAKRAVTGAKVMPETLDGSHIDEGSLGTVPTADFATTAANAQSALDANTAGHANTAGEASFAGNAQSAQRADTLDGLDSSQYLQTNSCQRGKILGFAEIIGREDTPRTFTSNPRYIDTSHNCTGGPVEVRRIANGTYVIRFQGNPATLAMSTGSHLHAAVYTTASSATNLDDYQPGTFRVQVFDALSRRGQRTDSAVTVVLP